MRVENRALHAEEGLDNHIVDSGPHDFHVNTQAAQVQLQGRKRPLIADVLFTGLLVLNEALVLFVDAVVCEMAVLRLLVVKVKLFACEAHEALVVDVEPQRVEARDYHVDPDVELHAIDQQR